MHASWSAAKATHLTRRTPARSGAHLPPNQVWLRCVHGCGTMSEILRWCATVAAHHAPRGGGTAPTTGPEGSGGAGFGLGDGGGAVGAVEGFAALSVVGEGAEVGAGVAVDVLPALAHAARHPVRTTLQHACIVIALRNSAIQFSSMWSRSDGR